MESRTSELACLMTRLRTTVGLLVWLLSAALVSAGEPFNDFLAGMREKGYFDYALVYLDLVSNDPKASAEMKTLVPFERAQTLIEWARSGQGGPDLAAKNYEQSLSLLEEFLAKNPNHPKSGQANSDRGRILLGKARIDSWNARSPGNEASKNEFLTRAFDNISKAREIFQKARDQHEAAWKSFGGFVDQKADPVTFEKRAQAEVRFIQAQLDLCECTYEEAQTYEKDSRQYKDKLTAAASEFNRVNARYRNQLGGLHARAKEGKCFEEQDDVQRALGIYDDLLSQPDESLPMIRLKDIVRHFRLICLNHPSRKDYQVVVDEATAWYSKASSSRRQSNVGLGIMWEQARAYEKLSEREGIVHSERDAFLRQAMKAIQTIKRNPGQYRDLVTSKERELLRTLKGGTDSDAPFDFSSAAAQAEDLTTKKTKEFLDALNAARKTGRSEEIQKANADMKAHIVATLKAIRVAQRMADKTTTLADINRLRYFAAYMHYLAKNSYECAIISEFLAKHSGPDNIAQAQESAYMALGAWVQSFNENEKAGRRDDQLIDVAGIERMANLFLKKWPSSDRAMDARLQMASVNATLSRQDEATKWLEGVPETSGRYAEAQQRSGQLLWTAYAEAASLPAVEQPPKEKLDDWLNRAEQHFRRSVDRLEKDTPAMAPPPETLTASKVALVQILVYKGEFAEGVKLLTEDPHQVMWAVAHSEPTSRPKTGVKSVDFASLAHQLLLRCYVGTQQLNEARTAMHQLELVGGGEGSHITEVYKELGQELQKEVERLKGTGQQSKLDAVRRSFETFLGELALRKDQTAGSLIWIGETYFGLGESSSDDAKRAERYFKDASEAYQQILDRVKEDAKFVDEDRVTAVRLRQAGCRRKQKQFDKAKSMLTPILTQNGNILDAQIEANQLYQDWGADAEKDRGRYYLLAIHGDPKLKSWGWGVTAKNIHRMINSGNPDAKVIYEDKLYQSIYAQMMCRYEYGMTLSGAKRKEQFNYALSELRSFVAISQDVKPEWWKKFDSKYRELLGKIGEPVKPLERPKPSVVTEAPKPELATNKEPEKKTDAASESTKKKAVAKKADAPAQSSGGGSGLVIFSLIALGGVGGIGYMLMQANKKKQARRGKLGDGEPAVATAKIRKPKRSAEEEA